MEDSVGGQIIMRLNLNVVIIGDQVGVEVLMFLEFEML